MKSELDNAIRITCENCGAVNVWGRSVKVHDAYGSDRGWFKFCFSCAKPTIEVNTHGPRGIVNSPMKEETYQRWLEQKGKDENNERQR